MDILLKQGEAQTEGLAVSQVATDVEEIINALQTRLSGLTDSFTGLSQQAFTEKMEALDLTERQVLAAIDALGVFLVKSADSMETLDAENATLLNSAG